MATNPSYSLVQFHISSPLNKMEFKLKMKIVLANGIVIDDGGGGSGGCGGPPRTIPLFLLLKIDNR